MGQVLLDAARTGQENTFDFQQRFDAAILGDTIEVYGDSGPSKVIVALGRNVAGVFTTDFQLYTGGGSEAYIDCTVNSFYFGGNFSGAARVDIVAKEWKFHSATVFGWASANLPDAMDARFYRGGAGGVVVDTNGGEAKVPLTVLGDAGQTAAHQVWQSPTTVYATVSENGYFTTRKNAAPVDAELAAGEAAYWFDSTNGAAKFMIKAKQADGTVVTGEVPLA